MTKTSEDIGSLVQLLQGSRERAFQSGDYETSIDEHDQVIRMCVKLQKSCNSSKVEQKLEQLKEKCRLELNLLSDIVRELNDFKNIPSHNKLPQPEKIVIDPDVWPPPTPAPQNRRAADDVLPQWARAAENEPVKQSALPTKKPELPQWRSNIDDKASRRDRDLDNRKRCDFVEHKYINYLTVFRFYMQKCC
jgi:hypothetical protein